MAGVKDTDIGYKSLMQRLTELSKKEVAVGVPASTTAKDGVSLALIAAVHEFGTIINMPGRGEGEGYSITIPQRSFLRSTLQDNQELIKKLADDLAKQVIKNKLSPTDALNRLGHAVVGLVQKKIQTGNFVPNAPSTIRKKKSSRPLIDTGHLRQSITHKVRPKGQK